MRLHPADFAWLAGVFLFIGATLSAHKTLREYQVSRRLPQTAPTPKSFVVRTLLLTAIFIGLGVFIPNPSPFFTIFEFFGASLMTILAVLLILAKRIIRKKIR